MVERTKEELVLEAMKNKSSRASIFLRLAFPCTGLTIFVLFYFGFGLATDVKHELIATPQGMQLAVYPTVDGPSKFVYTHDFINTEYDYQQYIILHYGSTNPFGSSTFSTSFYKIMPFIPFTPGDVSSQLRSEESNYYLLIALSILPLLAFFVLGMYYDDRAGKLSSKAYCANCNHPLRSHLGRDGEIHRCRFRVKREKETGESFWTSNRRDCECAKAELLDSSRLGKGPGQVKPIKALSPLRILVVMLILVSFYQAVLNPMISDYQTKQELKQIQSDIHANQTSSTSPLIQSGNG